MIKEILLLLAGGAITFVFTLLLNRISRRRPKLVWRILPPVHLPQENVTALQIIFVNEGDAPATNVRVIVGLGSKERIESVYVHPSEAAIDYLFPSKNPLELQFPRLPSQSNVTLSCIVHGPQEPAPKISIVGDGDTVGSEAESPSQERIQKMRRRLLKAYGSMYALLIFVMLTFVFWIIALSIEYRTAQQQIALGDLYYRSGDYESARHIYSDINSRWYEPPIYVVFVKLAAVANAQGRKQVAYDYLENIPDQHWETAFLHLSDPAFDSIRDESRFKELNKTKNK